MFINLCNIYLWQSVGILLKLEQAWVSKFAWLGLAWWQIKLLSQARFGLGKQVEYPRWAWVRLQRKWVFQARISLSSDISQVSRWVWAWDWEKKIPGLLHPALEFIWDHMGSLGLTQDCSRVHLVSLGFTQVYFRVHLGSLGFTLGFTLVH